MRSARASPEGCAAGPARLIRHRRRTGHRSSSGAALSVRRRLSRRSRGARRHQAEACRPTPGAPVRRPPIINGRLSTAHRRSRSSRAHRGWIHRLQDVRCHAPCQPGLQGRTERVFQSGRAMPAAVRHLLVIGTVLFAVRGSPFPPPAISASPPPGGHAGAFANDAGDHHSGLRGHLLDRSRGCTVRSSLRRRSSPLFTGNAGDVPILGPAFRDAHMHGDLAAFLSFALLLAVWRLWPARATIRRRSVTRGMKWATIAIASRHCSRRHPAGSSWDSSRSCCTKTIVHTL